MDRRRSDILKVFSAANFRSRIPDKTWDRIKKGEKSPLNYIIKCHNDLPASNSIEHSKRVLANCLRIIQNLGPSAMCKSSYLLILLYASLLHDIDKINNESIQEEIKDILDKTCRLFSAEETGHGIKSAHYMEERYKSKRILFYGIRKADVSQLFNVICFHSLGNMHACFSSSPQLKREEILLYLIFWVADLADGTYYRVQPDLTVNERIRSGKVRARGKVTEVKIRNSQILWYTGKISRDLRVAVGMENEKLSRHRLLLMAFGLPYRIMLVEQGQKLKKNDYLKPSDLVSDGLYLDVSNRNAPIVLSADTLPELYEKIVDAFCKVSVTGKLSPRNYFGPIVLEVRNIESDDSEAQTRVRSETGKTIRLMEQYTRNWLDSQQGAEKNFYYGYTHGQRIRRYLYPAKKEDYDKDLQSWTGEIDQFAHIVDLLREEKRQAKRAYAVIAHPIIDNPKSDLYHEEEMAPALLCLQFALEKAGRLSAFALLRSQELSNFFVVNYLETKDLIFGLLQELRKSIPNIKAGRIVMMAAIGYFDPNTVLLDKPDICKLGKLDLRDIAEGIERYDKKRQFIILLRDFAKDYIKIETQWCEVFKDHLPMRFKADFSTLAGELISLDKEVKTKGYSVTTEAIRSKKSKIVMDFIEKIK